MSKSWTDLSDEEFEQVLDNLSDPEYGQLTDAEFFGALLAMDEADYLLQTDFYQDFFGLVNERKSKGKNLIKGILRDPEMVKAYSACTTIYKT